MKFTYHFLFAALVLFLSGCIEDELAFDIVESPVLAVFEDLPDDGGDMLKVKATFYELDKSGILDNATGIDSMPISGLDLSVFIYEDELIGDFETDAEGTVIFEKAVDELNGASRLEWVGHYKEQAFRIYKNF